MTDLETTLNQADPDTAPSEAEQRHAIWQDYLNRIHQGQRSPEQAAGNAMTPLNQRLQTLFGLNEPPNRQTAYGICVPYLDAVDHFAQCCTDIEPRHFSLAAQRMDAAYLAANAAVQEIDALPKNGWGVIDQHDALRADIYRRNRSGGPEPDAALHDFLAQFPTDSDDFLDRFFDQGPSTTIDAHWREHPEIRADHLHIISQTYGHIARQHSPEAAESMAAIILELLMIGPRLALINLANHLDYFQDDAEPAPIFKYEGMGYNDVADNIINDFTAVEADVSRGIAQAIRDQNPTAMAQYLDHAELIHRNQPDQLESGNLPELAYSISRTLQTLRLDRYARELAHSFQHRVQHEAASERATTEATRDRIIAETDNLVDRHILTARLYPVQIAPQPQGGGYIATLRDFPELSARIAHTADDAFLSVVARLRQHLGQTPSLADHLPPATAARSGDRLAVIHPQQPLS